MAGSWNHTVENPTEFICETTVTTGLGVNRACGVHATHIYGPECEVQTGQLMYLCESHAAMISLWKISNPNEPVECPTHGSIGRAKDYLILKEM